MGFGGEGRSWGLAERGDDGCWRRGEIMGVGGERSWGLAERERSRGLVERGGLIERERHGVWCCMEPHPRHASHQIPFTPVSTALISTFL